jgi:hypothetical protein
MTQDQKKLTTPKLLTHEWITVLSLLGFLLLLTLIVTFFSSSSHDTLNPHYLVDQKIEVYIEGAVEKPGVYQVDRGTPLKAILEEAKPLKEAYLKKINLEKKLKKKWQVISIPKSEMITVYIQGAVENVGPITLPKGSTFQDLEAYVQFKESADRDILKRKRKLKASETITFPAKK